MKDLTKKKTTKNELLSNHVKLKQHHNTGFLYSVFLPFFFLGLLNSSSPFVSSSLTISLEKHPLKTNVLHLQNLRSLPRMAAYLCEHRFPPSGQVHAEQHTLTVFCLSKLTFQQSKGKL